VNDLLFECQASALQKIKWLLVMENGAPFTSNDHYFRDYREKFLKSYREARQTLELMEEIVDVYELDPELIAQDPYDQALHHMASARAYFQGSHQPKVLYFRWMTYRPFSCVQAAHGHSSDDDRPGTPARIRLEPWTVHRPHERSWNHWTW